MTVPRGYNPVRLIEEFPGIQIHWVRPDVYELGATNIMTPQVIGSGAISLNVQSLS